MAKLLRQKIGHESIPASARAKWGVEAMDEGYVPFPKKFLRVLSQVMGSKEYEKLQVVLAFADYLRDGMKNPPSLQYLSFVAGLDEEVFRRRMQELKETNLVDVSGSEVTLMISLAGLKQEIQKQTAFADHPPAKTEMSPE